MMPWPPEADAALLACARHISLASGGIRPYQTALNRLGLQIPRESVRQRLGALGLAPINANGPGGSDRSR